MKINKWNLKDHGTINYLRSHIRVIKVQEIEEKGWAEKLFEEIMADNFLNLVKIMN